MKLHRIASVSAVALIALVAACRKDTGETASVNREPASVTTITSSAMETPAVRGPAGGTIETVDVGDDDRAVLVVVGAGDKAKQPIVHLTGMCTEAKSDLEAWSSSVRNHGTIIALEGDKPCTNGAGGRTWSMDIAALDRRIDAAIGAVRTVRGIDLDPKEIILVGESMGATRALALAGKSPQKYPRLVVVGAPEKLNATTVSGVKAVAVLAGEKEPQEIPKQNYDALSTAGMTTRWWTLDGAQHGDYGPSGAATMDEALTFVTR